MRTWIKTSIATALVAATAVGSGVALARGGGCDGPMGGPAAWHRMAPEDMQERMSERAELRLARLELALALTPQQQPAWKAFKESMSARAEKMAAQMQQRMQADRPDTALERLQRREEMGKLRQDELAETRKAVESFYPTLSDAQKTVFDAEFGRFGGGGRDGMGHGGPGRGMGPGRS